MSLPNLSGLRCVPCGKKFDDFDDAQESAPLRFRKNETLVDEANCAICYSELSGPAEGNAALGVEVEGLFDTCGHAFHRHCLSKYVVLGGTTCPIDRVLIGPETLQNLQGGIRVDVATRDQLEGAIVNGMGRDAIQRADPSIFDEALAIIAARYLGITALRYIPTRFYNINLFRTAFWREYANIDIYMPNPEAATLSGGIPGSALALSLAVREWRFYIRAGSPYRKTVVNADLLQLFEVEVQQIQTVDGVVQVRLSQDPSIQYRYANFFNTLNSGLRQIAEEWEDPLLPGVRITERSDVVEYMFAKKMADEMYLAIPYLQQLFNPDGQGVRYRRDYSVQVPGQTT